MEKKRWTTHSPQRHSARGAGSHSDRIGHLRRQAANHSAQKGDLHWPSLRSGRRWHKRNPSRRRTAPATACIAIRCAGQARPQATTACAYAIAVKGLVRALPAFQTREDDGKPSQEQSISNGQRQKGGSSPSQHPSPGKAGWRHSRAACFLPASPSRVVFPFSQFMDSYIPFYPIGQRRPGHKPKREIPSTRTRKRHTAGHWLPEEGEIHGQENSAQP